MRTRDAVQVMVTVLAPYVGGTMARSAAEAQCRKLGLLDESIAPEQIELVLGKLGSGLNIFLGRERSGSVIAEVRRALQAAGGTP
ncbi:MAG: hypothetical protein ACM3PV_16330 [Betaproteobacteria bacterium]|jgi:hypothetical protein